MFSCNSCHLHFCSGGNTAGVERIPKYESTQKVDPGEENSHAVPAVTELDMRLFNHEAGTLTTELVVAF